MLFALERGICAFCKAMAFWSIPICDNRLYDAFRSGYNPDFDSAMSSSFKGFSDIPRSELARAREPAQLLDCPRGKPGREPAFGNHEHHKDGGRTDHGKRHEP